MTTEKKKTGEKNGKRQTFLEATNVVASGPPERRPTGTPTARAKKKRVLTREHFKLDPKYTPAWYCKLNVQSC